MDYQKQYDKIIENASKENRFKGQGIYYEEHHIIPKCLGGSDSKDNKVLLTAKEHFMCHKFLTRIYPNHKGIAYALRCMMSFNNKRNNKITARDYAYLREILPDAWNKGKKCPQCSTRQYGDKNGMYGRKRSKDLLTKMSEGRTKRYERIRLERMYDSVIHPHIKLKYKRDRTIEEKQYYKEMGGKGSGMKLKKKLIIESYLLNPSKCKQCDSIIEYDKRFNTFCSWKCYKEQF